MITDVLVIGGGPSGLTAAIYARRSGLSVTIIEKESFGGQIATSPRVENFPGFKSISGAELGDLMFDQATELGAEVEMDEIKSITKTNEGIFIANGQYSNFEAYSIIIASGVKHRKLNAINEDKFLGKGVSYCAVCDGAFFAGNDVVVIGDANSALQYALSLAAICPKVTIATLFDKFFAEEALVKAIKAKDNIEYHHNLNTVSFDGGDRLESVTFEDTLTKEKSVISCSGAFIAIGQVPDNERYVPLATLEKGFIVVDQNMQTSTPGLFAVGDCRVKGVRQLTTAVNDGAIAALAAAKYLATAK